MAKFHVSATVVGSKYIGEFEAATAEEAIRKAQAEAHVSLCYQCASEVEGAEPMEFHAEKAKSRRRTPAKSSAS